MISVALALLTVAQGSKTPEPTVGHPILLPTEYVEHRFAVLPVTESGRKLRLFTDSAGGHFLFRKVAEELRLTPPVIPGSPKKTITIPFPAFKPAASIPASIGAPLFVYDEKVTEGAFTDYDGMLGQQWFAGRVWTFDYPGKKLFWRAAGDIPKHAPDHAARLSFRSFSSGKRQTNFARIEITVDGEVISFLLDTGATNVLSEEALKQIGDGRPADRATSFLTRGTYEKWHAKHPAWRTITAKSLTGSVLIEVPEITVAGFKVGPVWFSVQPDQAFHKYMAQWMDKPTEGALGGSALKYFRLTVDWPNAIAVFERT